MMEIKEKYPDYISVIKDEVTTTRGIMKTADLEKKTSIIDNDHEYTQVIEYWFKGEQVHRSAHVHLKKNVIAEGMAAAF